MAVDLSDGLQDTKTEAHELSPLAGALAAVCSQLDPAEAQVRIDNAVDSVAGRFRNPKNSVLASTMPTGALGKLWPGLDRSQLARVADTFCTALSDPDGQRYKLELHIDMFKKVAARMDDRDLERLLDRPLTAGPVQRAILDIMGQSKKRSFRNTWDYLDWRRSNSG
jgi:hypothetical protein